LSRDLIVPGPNRRYPEPKRGTQLSRTGTSSIASFVLELLYARNLLLP